MSASAEDDDGESPSLRYPTLEDVRGLLLEGIGREGPTLIEVEMDRGWKPV